MKNPKNKTKPDAPVSILSAWTTIVWNSRFRIPLIIFSAFTLAVFAVWQSIPEGSRTDLIRWVGGKVAEKADLRVEVRGASTSDQAVALSRVRHDVAQMFMSHMSVVAGDNAATSARNRLEIELKSPPGISDLYISASLNDARGMLVATLPDVRVQTMDLDAAAPLILYGLDVSPKSLEPLHTKDRPTLSLEAYAKYEAGRRAYSRANFERALALFQEAINLDPRFAMAYWTVGELLKKRPYLISNDRDEAYWKARASEISADHPKWPLDPSGTGNPVPALRSLLLNTRADSTQGYEFTTAYSSDYAIRVLYWRFPASGFDIEIFAQSAPTGISLQELAKSKSAILAVNGGFYEIDNERRTRPTGLVIVGGWTDPGDHPNLGGSGVLYRQNGVWHIVPIEEFLRRQPNEPFDYALQAGPRLVERGGLRGIRSDNGSAVSRTAICLEGDQLGVLIVDGDITLFQLSDLMATPTGQGGLGCEVALNLDGGPSTQASYLMQGKRIQVGSENPPSIPIALVVQRAKS